ncbi:MAG: sugar phosphate isomerase/epimerase family protein, partial [Promethearchaeota archaeon]
MKPAEQLSVITDEIGHDIGTFLPRLKREGIKAVELRGVWHKNIIDFSDAELESLKALLDENGMVVSNVAGPLFKCYAPWTSKHDPNSKSFSRNVETSRNRLERAIEICRMLGCPRTRVFGYLQPFNFVKFMFSFKYPEVTGEQWQALVDDLTSFVDMAKQEKITILIENEAMSLVSTWESTLRILNDIVDSYFKLLVDPGNYFFCNEIHDNETYLSIKERIGHHH